MKVCFFANVARKDIEKIEFYAVDLRILQEAGHEVVIAETPQDLLRITGVDLYYVWWWNRALAPIALAKLRGAKSVVCGVFDYFLPYPTRYDYVSRPFWQRCLMRNALRYADANVFICNYEFDLVRRFLPVANARMIYLAIDTERYKCKVAPPIAKKLLNIAWSGEENARRKGLFELVSAIPRILSVHPDTTLVLAGRRGPALPKLQALAASLRVDHAVSFPGELTLAEKIEHMQSASLYVQPSMYEGFGSAVAEAMACGTSAACTLAGSLPEVIRDVGEPIAAATPGSIADCILRFLALPGPEQFSRGLRCSQTVRNVFTYESRRNAISSLIESVVHG